MSMATSFLQFHKSSSVGQVLRLLRDIGGGVINDSAQNVLLECIENPVSEKFPPGNSYYNRLLKALVLSAEQEEQALLDRLVEFHQCILLEPPQVCACLTNLSKNQDNTNDVMFALRERPGKQ